MRNPGMNSGGVHFDFGNMDINDIFRSFGFGGGGGASFDPFVHNRQQPRRNRDIRVEVVVNITETLQEQSKTLSIQTAKGTRENVEVKIPRGVQDGNSIKYPNLGDNFFDSLPRGDLYINIRMAPHPGYSIVGNDVYTTVHVDCLTALSGGSVKVRGFDGREFEISIPSGTQHETGLRIRDQGLFRLNDLTRGNLIAKIHITVPKLNEQQIELVNQIKQLQ
jgi:DnaJ-class molecular chaperone